MKICITANAEGLNAPIDSRFGRCQYFVIVDSETGEFESLSNEALSASGGSGVQAAQSISNRGIDVLLTGSIGPNAFRILSAAGIKMMGGANGSVSDSVDQYRSGLLQEMNSPTSPGHSGGSSGQGNDGRGKGRGMGGRR